MNAIIARLLVLALLTFPVFGVVTQKNPEKVGRSIGKRVTAVPLAAEKLALREPVVTIGPSAELEPDALEEIVEWNRAGKLPLRNGLVRELDQPIEFEAGDLHARKAAAVRSAESFGDDRVLLGARLRVEGASRIRLHLSESSLPGNAVLLVWGLNSEPVPFGPELATEDGEIWTPSVAGEEIFLEVQAPKGSSIYFMVDRVLEILPASLLSGIGPRDGHCVVDASCVESSTLGVIDSYRFAVAQLNFVTSQGGAVCSGALLADTDLSTDVPFLLTANHCFSTQGAAQSLEAFWDYRTSQCDGAPPSLDSLSRSNGATLMATSPATDVTLVRLNDVPAGRVFLGWTLNPSLTGEGAVLHRISHPFPNSAFDPLPQSYTRSRITTTSFECDQTERPNYIYSTKEDGATFGGSSGAPVIVDGGFAVGQLLGGCGSDDECASDDLQVDGAFSQSWPLLQEHLAPSDGGDGGDECVPCVADATTACLIDGRFQVKVAWKNEFFQPVTEGVGSIITYAENAPEVHPQFGTLSENAFFSMFAHAPNRVELVVKMFKGVNINDMFWVTAAGLTNNEYTITITDTNTCQQVQYRNSHNRFSIISDFTAFPFP